MACLIMSLIIVSRLSWVCSCPPSFLFDGGKVLFNQCMHHGILCMTCNFWTIIADFYILFPCFCDWLRRQRIWSMNKVIRMRSKAMCLLLWGIHAIQYCFLLAHCSHFVPLKTVESRLIYIWRWEGITCKRIFRKIIMGHVSNTD